MKNKFFLTVIISSCIFAINCYADTGPSSSQNPQSTSTQKFASTVKAVNRVQLPNQTQIQILLATDQGDVLVIVGPANFVDQSKVKFLSGDKVTVTGYPVVVNGNRLIIAAQIQKNGSTLQLLGENRQPLWNRSG